jgi:hypothetical protein
MQDYTRKRKLLTKIIIITVYISLFSYLLGDIQSIANWNYTIHEILYLPITLAIYVLPIIFIFWSYYFFKSFKLFRTSLSLKEVLKNFGIVLSVLVILLFFLVQQKSITTSGIYIIENKAKIERSYYIKLNNKSVRCTWNEYNLIETGKTYLITYEWNQLLHQKGKLEYIEPVKGGAYD